MSEHIDREDNKPFRLVKMHAALMRGGEIDKAALMDEFGVSEKTFRRDIDDLRAYLTDESGASIEYDRAAKKYRLVRAAREWMTNEDILIFSKILLESRAFPKAELDALIAKLLAQASPNERRFIRDMIKNEQFLYVEPRHGKKMTSRVWQLSRAVSEHEVIKFTYTKQDGSRVRRTVRPVAVMFSEFYFYLAAFIEGHDEKYPALYRVDRIEHIEDTDERFEVPYAERFSDGEFRRRVQFMYAGPLCRVTFDFKGDSLEAVLDRLPTAEVMRTHPDGTATIRAEAFGRGIEMWLGSQGDFVRNVRVEAI